VQIKPDYLAAKRELEALQNSLASDISAQQKIQGKETFQQTEFESLPSDEAEKRARQLMNQGRTDEAIRYFELALRDRPEDTNLNKVLGFLFFRQNRFSDALERYSRAQSSSPNDAEIPYAIGLIYMKTQLPEKAETSFLQAIRLQSNMVKAVFALGESLEAQQRFEDAVFQFRRCLEMNPNLKEADNKLTYLAGRQSYNYFSRGSYFYQRGEYEKAEPLLALARNYGRLTDDQNRQVDEMLNASRFWINKKQAQEKVEKERRQVSNQSYITKTINVIDVSQNPVPYIGKAVEWRGKVQFVTTRKNKKVVFVNSQSSVNFPKDLPNDARIGMGSDVSVKGKIDRVEKIQNLRTSAFSSRKQPIVLASEVVFTRTNYDQPLVIRFY
jgi:Flp pilus assembly protein TadD